MQVCWHPKYAGYGLDPEGQPVSRNRGRCPRRIKVARDGAVKVVHEGRHTRLSLRRFAAECRSGKVMPRPSSLRNRDITQAIQDLRSQGQSPTVEAVARHLGSTPEKVARAWERLRSHQGERAKSERRKTDQLRLRLARFRRAVQAKRRRTGHGRLSLRELIDLFPDAPDGPLAQEIKETLSSRSRKEVSP